MSADLSGCRQQPRLRLKPETPRSALDGLATFVESNITPDGFAVNTMLPPFAPFQDADPARPDYANPHSSMTLPPDRRQAERA